MHDGIHPPPPGPGPPVGLDTPHVGLDPPGCGPGHAPPARPPNLPLVMGLDPPPRGQTDTCKHNFRKLCLRAVMNVAVHARDQEILKVLQRKLLSVD